ncbi:4Fe-4S ferredoxin iron-sulfur binding domain protein [Thermoanaerobacterium thermosaccharolyticum DSM 571]|uniref:4Fe-4S ferredoxin iron-sulfur binding domain protein n=1 Tax=Thermoanaerobacterium thermosaccharolyticum (strain ATCC 7956 / DSM 571 / NCIMB 9385 / NCA 3814 / NCTC 13789 / WDCM 00135 / 2032) TaxID=580327 RepID=D9TNG6_THETC|nr:4Fe-4S double cluster binding domain-containing protein [Thermoanaerobacterium thermosaccharolyticum]ADL68572.1 4Fe-4S ferredoxin iron-sulfur binding domain protein [Thermoanaerobacterium thermosaccharolyticum DSM 571]
MNRQLIVEEKMKEWGASIVGFSDLIDVLPDDLKDLRYGITVAVKLSDRIINEINDKPTYTYFHHYRSVNTLIDQITLKTVLMMEEWGYNALAVPASQSIKELGEYRGLFQHKTAATKAGLGWIGKNGLLVTEKYGPRVRLGTVLTDFELDTGKPIETSKCGNCTLCVKSCPAMALHGKLWEAGIERKEIVDAQACSEYMNKNFKHIGRGSVCGICIKVCPYGIKN